MEEILNPFELQSEETTDELNRFAADKRVAQSGFFLLTRNTFHFKSDNVLVCWSKVMMLEYEV